MSSYLFHIVTYYIEWLTSSWTDSIQSNGMSINNPCPDDHGTYLYLMITQKLVRTQGEISI